MRLLWDEYYAAHPEGYKYSQFCEHYRQWASHLQPTMRLCHTCTRYARAVQCVAGERLFVDYAGQTIPIVHPETGEVQAAQIFVAVLGASSYTYVEAHLHHAPAHPRCAGDMGGPAQLDRRTCPRVGVLGRCA